MSRARLLLLGFMALLLSGFVTFLAYRVLTQRGTASPQVDQIVVATEPLNVGARLTSENLRLASWPRGMAMEGSFNDMAEVEGRGVLVPIYPNEPILEAKLAPREGGAGMAVAIPAGMRAVAVKVDDVVGVAGYVLAGTRVDVILAGSPEEGHQTDTAKVFLENVQVLAAGQNLGYDMDGRPQNVPVVTLLVTPDDAQKLALASIDGRIRLALRNPLDQEEHDPYPTRRGALYARSTPEPPAPAPAPVRRAAVRPPAPSPPAPVAAEPPPPRKVNVEVIQGSQRTNFVFEESNTQP